MEHLSYGDMWMTLIAAVAVIQHIRQVGQTLVRYG